MSNKIETREIINSSLTCVECLSRFIDPRVCPCGHTFCHMCIESLLCENRFFDCPSCQASHQHLAKKKPVPSSGFPPNRALISILRKLNAETNICVDKQLRENLDVIESEISELEKLNNYPIEVIVEYCNQLRHKLDLEYKRQVERIDEFKETWIRNVESKMEAFQKNQSLINGIREYTTNWCDKLKNSELDPTRTQKALGESKLKIDQLRRVNNELKDLIFKKKTKQNDEYDDYHRDGFEEEITNHQDKRKKPNEDELFRLFHLQSRNPSSSIMIHNDENNNNLPPFIAARYNELNLIDVLNIRIRQSSVGRLDNGQYVISGQNHGNFSILIFDSQLKRVVASWQVKSNFQSRLRTFASCDLVVTKLYEHPQEYARFLVFDNRLNVMAERKMNGLMTVDNRMVYVLLLESQQKKIQVFDQELKLVRQIDLSFLKLPLFDVFVVRNGSIFFFDLIGKNHVRVYDLETGSLMSRFCISTQNEILKNPIFTYENRNYILTVRLNRFTQYFEIYDESGECVCQTEVRFNSRLDILIAHNNKLSFFDAFTLTLYEAT